jgi:hypothetical protein
MIDPGGGWEPATQAVLWQGGGGLLGLDRLLEQLEI